MQLMAKIEFTSMGGAQITGWAYTLGNARLSQLVTIKPSVGCSNQSSLGTTPLPTLLNQDV